MTRLIRRLSFLALLFALPLAAASPRTDDDARDTRFADRVRGDIATEKITHEDGVLYEALAIAQPDLLPGDYRAVLPHCGTPLMVALAADLHKADPQVQYFVRYLLSAPSVRRRVEEPTLDTATLTHPELATTALQKARAAATSSNILLTAHFEIDYETAGGDATTLSYAQQIGTMMEVAYGSEIGSMGFTAPVAPQDGLINVVLKSSVPCPLIPFIDIPCTDVLGAAVPASLTLTSLGDPTVYLKTAYGTGNEMATTGAHEFFHLVQYQAGGIFPNVISPWWMEGGATAMETAVYPSVYDYVGWLQGGNGFYAKTDYALEAFSYEAVIFHRFLMEKYSGGNMVLMRDAMNALGSTSSAYLAVQGALTSRGTSWEEALHQFGLWNFFTGARTMPGYYTAASQYPTFNNFSANHTMSNSVPTVAATSVIVEPHGSKVIQIRPDSALTSQRKLTVKVDGDSFGGVRGWVVTRRQNGSTDIQDLGFGAGLPNTNLITINDFSYTTVGEVVIILTNTNLATELVATYEVKLAVRIDLAFCMDTTGSMSGSINALKGTATSAMTTLGSNGADFRIAITEFKDFPCCGGSPGDYPYLADFALLESALRHSRRHQHALRDGRRRRAGVAILRDHGRRQRVRHRPVAHGREEGDRGDDGCPAEGSRARHRLHRGVSRRGGAGRRHRRELAASCDAVERQPAPAHRERRIEPDRDLRRRNRQRSLRVRGALAALIGHRRQGLHGLVQHHRHRDGAPGSDRRDQLRHESPTAPAAARESPAERERRDRHPVAALAAGFQDGADHDRKRRGCGRRCRHAPRHRDHPGRAGLRQTSGRHRRRHRDRERPRGS